MFVWVQNARCEELHLHAENLSRRVWELLMLLPTCPKMLQAFQNISDDTVSYQTHENRCRFCSCVTMCLISLSNTERVCVCLEWGWSLLEGAPED